MLAWSDPQQRNVPRGFRIIYEAIKYCYVCSSEQSEWVRAMIGSKNKRGLSCHLESLTPHSPKLSSWNPVPTFSLRFQKMMGLLFAVILMPFSAALSSDLPMRSYEYRQDFETTDPFQYWTSNGTYTVNSKGLSQTRASSGASSFKLDVTFGTATYLYYKIPITVPNVGQLQFTGDLYVESSGGPTVALGTNISLSPAPTSGVNDLGKIGTPTSNWVTQSSDLVAAGAKKATSLTTTYYATATAADVGIWTDNIGLYIFAPSGGSIVLYVDNLLVKGVVPVESNYRSLVNTAWQNYLTRVQADVNTMANYVINYTGGSSGPLVDTFIQSAKSQATSTKSSVQQIGYPSPALYASLKSSYQTMPPLSQYVTFQKAHPDQALFTFPFQPIMSVTNSPRILPATIPGFAPIGDGISLQACRGEYEPASFVVRAERSVAAIQMTASDLIGPGERKIPASAVDIKLVKCWYQAGDMTIQKTDQRVLLPELLLNDDNLVKVDYGQQRNFLKVTIGGIEQYIGNSLPDETIPDNAVIKDADVLQPFDLDAESNKQVWVTIHVPEDAVAGDYKGVIRLQSAGIPSVDMNVTVTVLPFDLQPPFLEYAIYYTGKLPTTPKNYIGSEWKTNEQYLAELKNMKNHGVLYPTLYQAKDQMLGTALSLRNQAGLPKDHLYSLGISAGSQTSTSDLNTLGNSVASWINFISGYGFGSLYVYGIDEASGVKLLSERAAWQKAKDSGAKVFVACYAGAVDIVGDLLDAPILFGAYNPNEVLKFHNYGKKVFSYANPQVGIEDAEIYRRNYGLGLASAGYDGAMDFAYQYSFGHIWNDFDNTIYRDHVFAYPTSNGVIDTVQWEGFREAVDDVRYLSTLIVSKNGQKDSVILWLSAILTERTNMYELRSQIINENLTKTKLSPPKALRSF
jgi:hypothetical protein